MPQSRAVVSSSNRLPSELRSAPTRLIDIGHSQLAYRRVGSGPDLVFVHGWPLDSNTFRELVPRLASDFTCHLFDLPGAGASLTSTASALQLREHPRSLLAAIDTLGLTRYALLAHDSGGYVARVLASQDRRVSALVLGNTELPDLTALVIRMLQLLLRLPYGQSLLMQALRLRAVRRSPLAFGGCFRNLDLIDGEFHQLFVAPLLDSPRRADDSLALLHSLDAHVTRELPAIHACVVAPTLLIWGGDDPIFPLAPACAMVSQFAGGAELEVIAGAKCFVHEEEPERFAELTRPFLRRAFSGAQNLT